MTQPFIRNHQYNIIHNETAYFHRTMRTVADSNVVEAIRHHAGAKIDAAFPEITEEQRELLKPLTLRQSETELAARLEALNQYRVAFPEVTDKLIRRLFPKSRKLKMPDLSVQRDYGLTYFSWADGGTGNMYLICEYNGEIVGIEGKFALTARNNLCSFCGGYGQVALVTAVTRAKQPSIPDYYKAIGNYICFQGHQCNSRITHTRGLEAFVRKVMEE